MGRLFQYNRFGSSDSSNKKDNLTRINSKSKESQPPAAKCPAYLELYPEYNGTTTTATVTTATSASPSPSPPTTSKSVELAIKKYQQWSSKFMPTTLTTGTTEDVSQSSSSTSSHLYSASSGYHSQETDDREMLVGALKRPKVYDCMKDFLRRKLFQQQQNASTQLQSEDIVDGKCLEEEDITSDYDEIDILDSSYNADEEDATDCSCSCSTCPNSDNEDDEVCLPTFSTHKSSSPQKSVLSLNCWQQSSQTDSTTEEEGELPTEEDSDAGISDCCQLISDNKKNPKRRNAIKSPKRSIRYNINDDFESELLESSWYQPRITTKAALGRLEQAPPGSFLVRRKTRTFELCLRLQSKVKQFPIISLVDSNTYKLKGAKKQFPTLKALVTHHSVMAEHLPVTLSLPRVKQLTAFESKRYADDFDTYESLQILGILKSLQAKSFEFS